MGLLVNGVDVNTGPSGTISATHGEEEMGLTVDAFRATIRALKREGAIVGTLSLGSGVRSDLYMTLVPVCAGTSRPHCLSGKKLLHGARL